MLQRNICENLKTVSNDDDKTKRRNLYIARKTIRERSSQKLLRDFSRKFSSRYIVVENVRQLLRFVAKDPQRASRDLLGMQVNLLFF